MCSDFLAENTSRAAALKTDCSRCNSWPEIPERTELHPIAPCDLCLFLLLEEHLHDTQFSSDNDVIASVDDFFGARIARRTFLQD